MDTLTIESNGDINFKNNDNNDNNDENTSKANTNTSSGKHIIGIVTVAITTTRMMTAGPAGGIPPT